MSLLKSLITATIINLVIFHSIAAQATTTLLKTAHVSGFDIVALASLMIIPAVLLGVLSLND